MRALDLLGDTGLTDVTDPIGYFTSVSMTFALYDVPAGASDYNPEVGWDVDFNGGHLDPGFRL